MSTREQRCDHCGETGRIKAEAWRGEEHRVLCHDNDKSCYEALRGNLFGDGTSAGFARALANLPKAVQDMLMADLKKLGQP